ncbi:DUF4082 domain-containing protein [Flavobacterium sp. MC2016-06]|jgi:hypothetical protein|uniref:DUF4082 domain-containing protein n=1 Tax=Flavobacterium sp. MC2016-06 TaxID=2676308 RepID=UPI0012BAC270|nr:DUF4082 domain-containing protein [Flavobacterium sp. MC2016-06]MBU3862445.1 DUF4082 domain-containing protein [Flavobacterium sp. MC2016-06]
MKTLKIFLTLFAAAIFSISCSSDNDSDSIKYSEENPLDAYLAATGFSQKASDIKNSSFYEYGFSFKPTVTGKINALIVKIPDVSTSLKVTLWDAAAKTIIKSEIVVVPTANVTVEKTITSIALTKDKEYYLTVNSNDWINRTKTDGTNATYPVTAGNITITGYGFVVTTEGNPIFPTTFPKTYYAGDVSFKFQQTE